jgi:hypothetical protein
LGKPDQTAPGSGQEFATFRSTGNRFYWISSDHALSGATPARVAARIANSNLIIVKMTGLKQLSIWLNAGMIDFEQPVDIRVNPSASSRTFKKIVQPSLQVLLEDFYTRGDKHNLFVARVDFQW